MINMASAVLVIILLTVLFSLGSDRLMALVKLMALQGIMVSIINLFVLPHDNLLGTGLILFAAMLLIKGLIIPGLMYTAVKKLSIQREAKPIIGYHASIFIGLGLILAAGVITARVQDSLPGLNPLLLISAIATLAAGLFLMLSRRKAITQVIGYLMMENGIYLMGTALAKQAHTMYVLEFGMLLDLLVAVMIMGIILNRINDAFDDVDTSLLGRLKD
jgi:hydrogenase-4 component E